MLTGDYEISLKQSGLMPTQPNFFWEFKPTSLEKPFITNTHYQQEMPWDNLPRKLRSQLGIVGSQNPILHLAPIDIFLNHLRGTQGLRIYQQNDLRNTFMKGVTFLKTTGICSFPGSPFLLSLFHHKFQSKLNCKDLLFYEKSNFLFNLFALKVIISNK